MSGLLFLLIGLPLTAFFLTYVAGRWLGRWASKACFYLSLLPVGAAFWQIYMVWTQANVADQGMAYGISGMGLMIALFLSFCSLMGLLWARRKASRVEAGIGLNPNSDGIG